MIEALSSLPTLKRHRSRQAGVSDLLNYGAVIENGIIACKNGSLMAAWMYTSSDTTSTTDEQKDYIASMLNIALSGLGNGWMIHVDAVRKPAPRYISNGISHFPDRVTAAIEEERRRLFENRGNMYEGYFVLTITYFPPLLAQAKFVELMFDDDGAPATPTGEFEKLLKTFKKDLETLESRLSSVLKLERLGKRKAQQEDGSTAVYDDFLQHLQVCITGIHQPVRLPSHPVYLDALLGGQELWGGVIPKMGRKFIQIVAIEGFPIESYPGMLSILTDLDVEYRWSNRFIFLDQHVATSHMDKFRRKWKQKQRGIIDHVFNTNGPVDADALAMTQDAEEAIASAKSNMVCFGYYTSVLVLMDEDRTLVEVAARKLEKAIFNLGFAARIETINTLDAFFGSLPGHGTENVRRPLINTLNLAHFLPSSTIWTGDDYAPCPMYPPSSPPLMYCVTTGNSPFRLNLHIRDLGHTIMFGPTGAGKSTALALLIAQFRRYKNASVFAFDKGLSLYPLCSACGGKHFTVAGDDSRLAFCPLQYLDTPADRAWALDWLDTILSLNNLQTGPEQRNEISRTLDNMHATGGKTLTEFVSAVQDKDIREVLQSYTVEGQMGSLLDAEEDGLSLTDFTTFEMEELMNLGKRWSLPVLLYLFRRIEKALKGQPALLALDEAWLLLGDEVFREKIREWLKVLRKSNCAVLMATQSISDAANSSIFDVIVESTPTKIFLPNAQARSDGIIEIYQKMGLNKQQINIIASAISKREYYLVSEKGCRKFDFAMGPLALSFVGASDRDTVLYLQELEKQHGPGWVDVWLESRGLALSAYEREEA